MRKQLYAGIFLPILNLTSNVYSRSRNVFHRNIISHLHKRCQKTTKFAGGKNSDCQVRLKGKVKICFCLFVCIFLLIPKQYLFGNAGWVDLSSLSYKMNAFLNNSACTLNSIWLLYNCMEVIF